MVSKKFVIADSNRCIGCKTCMAACIRAHEAQSKTAVPRLQLVTTLQISAPINCHHCIDAPCVEACPTGCLYSDDKHVGVHESKCIGCLNCMLACPFGAIAIESRPRVKMLGDLCIQSGQEPLVIKCDLCEGRSGGPACAEACPTGGLYLVDHDFLDERVEDKRIRATQVAESYAGAFSSLSVS